MHSDAHVLCYCRSLVVSNICVFLSAYYFHFYRTYYQHVSSGHLPNPMSSVAIVHVKSHFYT